MYNEPPIIVAAREGYENIVKELLADPSTDPNVRTEDGETALHEAINSNQTKAVKALLADPRVDVNVQNKFGETPLSLAAWHCRSDVVKWLLADPRTNPIKVDGAVHHEEFGIIDLFLKHDAYAPADLDVIKEKVPDIWIGNTTPGSKKPQLFL